MDRLVASILNAWPSQFATTNLSVTVALSGGVDSVSLLHLLFTIVQFQHLPYKIKLEAIHINHGISPNAISWENFCQNFCDQLGISLKICRHQVQKNGGESLENNARKIRYQEFLQHESDIIILAHHKFDQIETTLSQIFRGSDIHNIAAMRSITRRDDKIFWRPLLSYTKTDLEEYAQRNNLSHITDESNNDTSYLRNFIRNDILPRLIKWDKNIENKILNINVQIQNTLELTDEIAQTDYSICKSSLDDNINSLNASVFKELSSLRQHNLLNYYILHNSQPLPSTLQIREFIRQINNCKIDKSPRLELSKTHALIMSKNTIFILKNP